PLLIDGTMFTATPEASRAEIERIVGTLRFGAATPASVPMIEATIVRPGRVDIGGRSLFMECHGSGSPTVIFLAGTQVPRLAISGVEKGLADASVRVCDYDRAGEGSSD